VSPEPDICEIEFGGVSGLRCQLQADGRHTSVCVHEHIRRSRICALHAGEFETQPERFECRYCLSGAESHSCRPQLVSWEPDVVPVPEGASRERGR
jgi:hypothetical protein